MPKYGTVSQVLLQLVVASSSYSYASFVFSKLPASIHDSIYATLGTRVFFLACDGELRFVGHRPTRVWPKAEDTSGEIGNCA